MEPERERESPYPAIYHWAAVHHHVALHRARCLSKLPLTKLSPNRSNARDRGCVPNRFEERAPCMHRTPLMHHACDIVHPSRVTGSSRRERDSAGEGEARARNAPVLRGVGAAAAAREEDGPSVQVSGPPTHELTFGRWCAKAVAKNCVHVNYRGAYYPCSAALSSLFSRRDELTGTYP